MKNNYPEKHKFDLIKFNNFEQELDDVMELIDVDLIKRKLVEVETQVLNEPNEINKARLGIIYHEVALNLAFLSKTEYKGYAQKSFDLLSDLYISDKTTNELMSFVAAYRASALSLIVAETKKLKQLDQSFDLFAIAVREYGDISPLPEFMRGSVAENLPWFLFGKRKYAKIDFQSIIDKYEENEDYVNWKVMSFTYWASAKQYQGKKYREQTIEYLDKAIELDPEYKAGRKMAEELKAKLFY